MIRLPPTAALRALEAAARNLSYTRAAEELHVTQSAVSHQIRHVEELWGLKLFERRGRRLVLTVAGQTLAPVVREFMTRLEAALEELRSGSEHGSVRVTLLQSFAYKWLVPRLGRFNQHYPEIDVWLSTTDRYVDFNEDEVDLAIRLGDGGWAGVHVEPLLREYVFPVCSPHFLHHHEPPLTPADLLSYPLLHKVADEVGPHWSEWFRVAGVRLRRQPKGSRFPDTGLALQAALDGQGVALVRSAHVADDINAGRLLRLLDVPCPARFAYYLVFSKGALERPHVAAFRDWLLEEAVVSQREFDRVAGVGAALAQTATR